VVDRCRVPPLSTNLLLTTEEKEKTMSNYSNPALEAELAYRREQLRTSAERSRGRRWSFARRRHAL
jgi:hypothetical protein